MTPQEMIELRNAKASIEEAYDKAKKEATEAVIDTMCETGKGFTALEISKMTGLSVGAVTAEMTNPYLGLTRTKEYATIKMVVLDDDGVPNMGQIYHKRVKRNRYSISKANSIYKRWEEKNRPVAEAESTPKKMECASTVGDTFPSKMSVGGTMVKAMIEKYSG